MQALPPPAQVFCARPPVATTAATKRGKMTTAAPAPDPILDQRKALRKQLKKLKVAAKEDKSLLAEVKAVRQQLGQLGKVAKSIRAKARQEEERRAKKAKKAAAAAAAGGEPGGIKGVKKGKKRGREAEGQQQQQLAQAAEEAEDPAVAQGEELPPWASSPLLLMHLALQQAAARVALYNLLLPQARALAASAWPGGVRVDRAEGGGGIRWGELATGCLAQFRGQLDTVTAGCRCRCRCRCGCC